MASESFPLRFVQHLAYMAKSRTCEVTNDDGRGKCPHLTVAVRWEGGFADDVCLKHAERAQKRGAVVVFAKKHDGTEE